MNLKIGEAMCRTADSYTSVTTKPQVVGKTIATSAVSTIETCRNDDVLGDLAPLCSTELQVLNYSDSKHRRGIFAYMSLFKA